MGFKHKFMRYLTVRNWTYAESRDYLCWCLEGKASEFYATLVSRNQDIGFLELLTKMEKRFGGMPLPDTAQEQLSNSRQRHDETLEEWADRVMQMATRAFPDLPEDYMYRQAIKRICHGCLDREAGQHAVNQNLTTVDMVVDRIKSYQFNHKSIYDRSRKDFREVKEVQLSMSSSETSEDEDSAQIRQVRQSRSRERNSGRQFFDRGRFKGQRSDKDQGQVGKSEVFELRKEMGEIRDNVKSLIEHMETLKTRSYNSPSPSPVRNRSPSPIRCYHCQGQGHYARNCPKKLEGNKAAKSKEVTFSDDLNEKGSGQKA
ncbi:hypothetical protein FSP39_017500 [Pinctada imbricata]|uniref:CCHC-type domain-containing protein n=1 Tax=Pinctada imbricata TaxID=66713 RepID=A0AA88YU73_PINIB|nr:hypothetical protein FSP39_017500 [Pinctada imbricata]